ncbi:hypothetical protein [Gulosibacter sp. 10]|uniref:hypothetical protein n=1 Tax=Gulosibacter sp. 10 TaxID=1255570 RepID=UPI00097EDDA5|nr:hypothetical protein [Gulosibacter sp. 10]SJM51607.1 hypothetical protein FM112_02055 [Gulosibacter sp. 10]
MAPSAAALAERLVAAVRDDPGKRVRLLVRLYAHPEIGRSRLPYRRAAVAFMRWQLRRGLLDPGAGSPWWRAMNEDLLRTSAEAGYLVAGRPGGPSSPAAASAVRFLRRPSARHWYHAHNASVASAYLRHEALAAAEGRVERFFLNLVLMRVLYAHALVAAPRLALGPLAPLGPVLGDPRVGFSGIFLSLSRVLPNRYPLGEDVAPYVAREHGLGRLLDHGLVQPRLRALYDWSAAELGIPELAGLLVDGVPAYAWPAGDDADWRPGAGPVVRAARRLLPVRDARVPSWGIRHPRS